MDGIRFFGGWTHGQKVLTLRLNNWVTQKAHRCVNNGNTPADTEHALNYVHNEYKRVIALNNHWILINIDVAVLLSLSMLDRNV